MDFLKKFGMLMQNLNFKVFAPEDRFNFHEIEGCSIFNGKNTSIPILFQASFLPSMLSLKKVLYLWSLILYLTNSGT